VIENNLYGEYTRINLSTPVEDLAVRGASYAMPAEVVDGQDVDAVAGAMARAVDRARSGKGPTLLEMKTYRYSGHSRSDPATYRPPGELELWLKRDPIRIFAERLVGDGAAPPDLLDAILAETRDSVARAAEAALAAPEPPQAEILNHVTAASGGGDRRWSFWSR
jgi:pyruvate dehydrogenase E1 component alpha subunit